MAKSKKDLPPPSLGSSGKIPSKALKVAAEPSPDDLRPVFSFRFVDPSKRFPLSAWQGKELTELLGCLKKMEDMSWADIRKHSGLRCKAISDYPKITHFDLSPDMAMMELRVCEKKRIMGFRAEHVFCLVWFDRSHDVFAEGKPGKHK